MAGTVAAEKFRAEQLDTTPRTTDPTNTSAGEAWIRSDIAPETDQIGTLRFDTGSSTIDIPIFDAAASTGSDIEAHLQVVVGGTRGFVPTTDDGAAFEKVGVYDGGVRYGAHNSLDALPDSVVDNFEDADADPPGVYESEEDISDYYSGGNLSAFSRTTTNAVEGSKAIESVGTNVGGVVSTPDDGLNRYPTEGDTVAYLLREPDTVPFHGPLFNASVDANGVDGYTTYITSGSNEIRLSRVDDGTEGEQLVRGDTSLNLNTWYWLEFDIPASSGTSEGDIEVRVYDVDTTDLSRGNLLDTVNSNDTTYVDNDGVGLFKRLSNEGGVGIDYMRVI